MRVFAGEMKTKLRLQACWEVHPSYDVGLYVRAPHVQQLRLVPSPAGARVVYSDTFSKMQAAAMLCFDALSPVVPVDALRMPPLL
jgi:hypothetical protein